MFLQLLPPGLLILQPGLYQVLPVLQLIDAELVFKLCLPSLGEREVTLLPEDVWSLRAMLFSAILWGLKSGQKCGENGSWP